MEPTVMVAAIGFLGTSLGSVAGIIVSSKLTNYRIEQLEKKVEKHNSVVERTIKLEQMVKQHDDWLSDLENKVHE